MPSHWLGSVSLVSVVLYSSCGQHAITLQYRESEDYTFSRAELRTIQDIADETTREVRRLLPELPADLVLEVFAAEDVLEELGYTGEEAAPRFIYWGVNPHHGEGVASTAEAYLRPHLYQAFYRMLRFQSGNWRSFLDSMVGQGLITVFARDYADTTYPWTDYPPEAADWAEELIALPPGEAPWEYWMGRHPDGRRWMGIKAGTYLVDRAVAASGRSVMELVSLPSDEIIEMAGEAPAQR